MASVSSNVDELHKSLLTYLCDMMDPNESTYGNFIRCLESKNLPRGRLSRVQQDPADVFALMEQRGVLKVGKYQHLKKALETKAATVSSIKPQGQHDKKVKKLDKGIQQVKASTSGAADQVSAENKESDIVKLRDNLIKAYRNLRYVQVSPILDKEICDIDDIYVDLVIEEKQGSRNTEKGSKYVSTQCKDVQAIKVTSYTQIFLRKTGSKFEHVFLRGKGGLGKTTFCRKVLHAWCSAHEGRAVAHAGYFQDETVLKMFDLLFYLNLREVSVEENLIEVICAQFPLEDVPNKNNLGTLLKDNGDKILFILDGLDEMMVKPRFLEHVVTRRIYPNCCFLVSSRPWKISDMELREGPEINLLLGLKGFSEENAIKCAEKIFQNCYKDRNAIIQFSNDIANNKLVKQLIHVPLLLLILAQVWYENKRSLPSKLHELYILFLNLLADRMIEKYKKDPNHKQMRFTLDDTESPLPSKISKTSLVVNIGGGLLLSLCEVAHHFLLSGDRENSLVFEEDKLLKVLEKEKLDVALDLGILSVTDSVSYLNRKSSVCFLHKTLQEFFTALYFIFNPDKLANFIASIADLKDVEQNENIIIFLVGLMPKLGNSVLVKVNELYSDEILGKKGAIGTLAKYYRLYNINTLYFTCKEEVIGEDVQLNVSNLLLGTFDYLHHKNAAFQQYLMTCNKNYVDLRGFKGLTYLGLYDINCKLYLPQLDSLSVLIMDSVTQSSSCDVLDSTLTHCNKLKTLKIHKTDLNNCPLNLSNMTELRILDMSEVTMSSSCCDVLGSTLTHCTQLETLKIHKTELHNCLLNLSNVTELRILDMSEVTMSSSCCDVLGSTLTHCTQLETLKIHKTDLHNCLLNLSNVTELRILDMSEVTMSSSCCDVLSSTLTHCTQLTTLMIHKTDLHNCLLNLSNVTQLKILDMSEVTMSSICCDVLGSTLTHCTQLETFKIHKIDLNNCLLNLSNVTELGILDMPEITMSSSCGDVLGSTLTHCTKLTTLKIHKTDLHNCLLNLSNVTELKILDMSEVTMSSSCCDVLGSTLTHCTQLEILKIHKTDLHNCLLNLSNVTELRILDMSEVTMSSRCCDVLCSTLTHCTKLKSFSIHKTDLHNCLLNLTNVTELENMDMSEVTISSICFNVLRRKLTDCTKLDTVLIQKTDLHNCLLNLFNVTQLRILGMSEVTVSSSCDVLGSILTHCTQLTQLDIHKTDLHNCLLNLTNVTELRILNLDEVTMSSSCSDVLGSTLTYCTQLETLKIHKTDLHNCLLNLSNVTELIDLDLDEVTMSSSCCDVLGSTLTHCTQLETLTIHKTDLHNCLLNLSNVTELRILDMSEVTMSSRCCDVLCSTLTHCTQLEILKIHKTDLHNCLLNLSNVTELINLDLDEVTMSSSCCDVLGSTLTHCTQLETLKIHKTELHNCLLNLSNVTELRILDMSEVTMSSSCCDVLGSTLTHCTQLETLKIHKTDLHNCLLNLSNVTELRILDMSEVTMSSSCDVLGSTLTHCTELTTLRIHKTDLHNCLLNLSNVTELRILDMSEVTMSSSCCDVLGSTLTHCTQLETLQIHKTDLHNCLLNLTKVTELRILDMSEVTMSSSCCDVLGTTLTHCTKLKRLKIHKTDLHNCLLNLSNVTELTD